jgi:ribosomal protein S18 acetylase RimI-like enzyme
MAVGASPLPAAWVRVAAVESMAGFEQVDAMFAQIVEDLNPAIDEIAWFLTDYWPLYWLERMGFVPVSEVMAYRKNALTVPAYHAPSGLVIRPMAMEDLPLLAAIEVAAFEPRWRHSAQDLQLAWRHAICFEVALLDGHPVAFQFSTGGDGNAHLSRMTVHPAQQGMGIGAALLASAVRSYQLQNISSVTLNTQADNLASRRLYERFGFRPTGHSYPVWAYYPAHAQSNA